LNFLAHAYLSGDDPELLFGNFVADSIKGKTLETFAPKVRDGVMLHRSIDAFTDQHPLVRECVALLQPTFRKYSGVVVDIYFDHFLALHWQKFSETDLTQFASGVYRVMIMRFVNLPPRSKRIIPWMIAQNWLVGYANLRDLDRVFRGMSRRARFDSGMENSVGFLIENYSFFEEKFLAFFPLLINHSISYLAYYNSNIRKTS
jgi:acyl carrier protein phosphodiesterase